VLDDTTLKLSPFLVSLNPPSGSIGGTLIIAQVKGIGPQSKNITLVDKNNQDICEKVSISQPGELRCLTKKLTMIDSELSVQTSSNVVGCGNPDASLCHFTQIDTNRFPVVLTAKITSDYEMEIHGLNLDFDPSFNPMIAFAGVNASSLVVSSRSLMKAKWTNGVPPSSSSTPPSVYFFDSTGVVHHAFNQAQVKRPLETVSSSEAGQECSFAGGCLLEVKAKGAADLFNLDPESNFISVCGSRCEIEADRASSDGFTCKIPKMISQFSYDVHRVGKVPTDLDSGMYLGSGEQLWDEDLMTVVEGEEDELIAGMDFGEGALAIISEVKYLLSEAEDGYAGILKFQGSKDNDAWEDLFTTDDNAHEGWNSFTWQHTQPKFRFFRFYSMFPTASVTEAALVGTKLWENADSEIGCEPLVYFEGEPFAYLEEVTYVSDLTPTIKAMSPTYGSVKGETTVTFSGENLPEDQSLITTEIDGVECLVQSSNETTFSCVTGPRPDLVSPSLQIFVQGQGSASLLEDLNF